MLPYLDSLSADYTFDDLIVVRDNPVVHDDSLWPLLTWVYQPGAYRPVTMLSYAANARLGERAFGFHMANIALHALASLSVFGIARLVLVSDVGAVVAALLFAAHPIHTESVTSIVGRAEILAALFVLAAILASVRAGYESGGTGSLATSKLRRNSGPYPVRRGSYRRLWGALSLAAFAAALLSKESAFSGIALIGVVHWWLDPELRLRQAMTVLVPYLAMGLAVLGLRLLVVGSLGLPTPPNFMDNPLAYLPWHVRVETAAVILWQYLSQLALPLQFSADYSFAEITPVTSPLDGRFVLAMSVFAALSAGLIVAARRAPGLLVAACFGAIPIALTANLLFPIGTIKAERLLYLPSVGWCLAWGWAAARIPRERWPAATVALSLVVALLGARAWVRNRDWHDNLSLFTATVATSPNSAKAHYNLAVAHKLEGHWGNAMNHFRRALAIYPAYADAAAGIGEAYSARGLDVAALHWYEVAVMLDWSMKKVHISAALLHLRQGGLDAAEAAIHGALESDPEDGELLARLAAVRLEQGDLWGARTLVNRATQLASDDVGKMELILTVDSMIDREAIE